MGKRSKRLRAQFHQYRRDESGSYYAVIHSRGASTEKQNSSAERIISFTTPYCCSLCWVWATNVKMFISKRQIVYILILFCACITAIGIGIGVGLPRYSAKSDELPQEFLINRNPQFEVWGDQGSGTLYEEYKKAAISSDGAPCSSVAKDILFMNGSAADSAIAALFCLGVVNAQSMGLGGGFLLTYYDKSTARAHVLDARETAPAGIIEHMFRGNGTLSKTGGLAVAVPGELRGYFDLHRRFGHLPWAKLIEPALKLCEEGYPVNSHMAKNLKRLEKAILDESSLRVFVNEKTGQVWNEGDIMTRPRLAKTLRVLMDDPDALYTGVLATKFAKDIQSHGGIITEEDLTNYRPRWRDPISVNLTHGGYRVFSPPPPGSGLISGFILNIMDEFKLSSESFNKENSIETYQILTESMKYAYARRSQLADVDFRNMSSFITSMSSDEYARKLKTVIAKDGTFNDFKHYGGVFFTSNDAGTTHLSLIAPNGDAVSVTSSVNIYFGALFMSIQTGIIPNDQMDDFSFPGFTNYFGLPPSPANFVKPGKRPLSSMCPAIFVDEKNNVKLAIGAAGGTKISSAVALVSLKYLWANMSLKEAIAERRIHHQLYPMVLEYEEGFSFDILRGLEGMGHRLKEFVVGGSVVCAVARQDGKLIASADFRKSTQVDGF